MNTQIQTVTGVIDFGRTGDTLVSLTPMTTADDSAAKFAVDWAPQGGFALGTAGPYSVHGPTCPTPTAGGVIPRNPLWVQGQPCNIVNPIPPGGGRGFRNSGVTMLF